MCKVKHFFNNVKIKLGYYDWKLRLISDSVEGYCWHKQKVIEIGMKSSKPKQLVLHEIAHIDTCRFCNNMHRIEFWIRYEDLMRRFLPDVSFQKRYNENIGHFGLCYEIRAG